MRRVLYMLRATANRDANRLLLTLAPAFYLLVTILMMVILFPYANVSRPPLGTNCFRVQLVLSIPMMAFVSVRVASDVLGIHGAAWRDLLKLSGTTAWQWLSVRWLQSMLTICIVQLTRLPLLFLLFTFGGITFETLVISEVLLLGLNTTACAFGLFAAYASQTRGQVIGCVTLFLIAVEALFNIPGRAFSYRRVAPYVTPSMAEFADVLLGFRLGPQFLRTMIGTSRWDAALLPLLTYLVIAALTLWYLTYLLFSMDDDSPHEVSEVAEVEEKEIVITDILVGPRERCWDDALAWQSRELHLGGKSSRSIKWWVLGAIVAGMGVTIYYGIFPDIWGLFAVVGPLSLVNSMGAVGNCLEKEVKENTMSTLMLTPHSNMEFYLGWQRGIWKSLRADWFACGVSLSLAAIFNREMMFVVLAAIIAVASSTPFLTLATVVPLTPKGIPISFLVVFFLVLFVVLAIVIGATTSPILGSLFAVVTLWVFNALIYRYILPAWMDRKMSGVLQNS